MGRDRQYISVEVNSGVCFKVKSEMINFTIGLCKELHKKLKALEMTGRTLAVKLQITRAGMPKPDREFTGHALYDNKIQSVTFPQHTDDLGMFCRQCRKMLLQLRVPPTDIRGVGVQLSTLQSASGCPDLSTSFKDLLKSGAANKKASNSLGRDSANSVPSLSTGKHYPLLNFVKPKKRVLSTNYPTDPGSSRSKKKVPSSNNLSGQTSVFKSPCIRNFHDEVDGSPKASDRIKNVFHQDSTSNHSKDKLSHKFSRYTVASMKECCSDKDTPKSQQYHSKTVSLSNDQEGASAKNSARDSNPSNSKEGLTFSRSPETARDRNKQDISRSTNLWKSAKPRSFQESSSPSRTSQGGSIPRIPSQGWNPSSQSGSSPEGVPSCKSREESTQRRSSPECSNFIETSQNFCSIPGQSQPGSDPTFSQKESNLNSSDGNCTKSSDVASHKIKRHSWQANDPTFLSAFYSRSTYHHLSTWRMEHQKFVNGLQKVEERKFPGKQKLHVLMESCNTEAGSGKDTKHPIPSGYSLPTTNLVVQERGINCKKMFEEKSVIMHIDMDCFFVAVSLLEYPELRGKPVAVTGHSAAMRTPVKVDMPDNFDRAHLEKKSWNCPTAKLIKSKSRKETTEQTSLTGDVTGRTVNNTTEQQGSNGQQASSRQSVNVERNKGCKEPASNQEKKGNMDSVTVETPAGNWLLFNPLAEIASCSYEARAFGVGKGMLLSKGLELCPHLKTVPYDFESYHRVSRILYETVASFTNEIGAISCDDMFVDVTKTLRDTTASPLEFAQLVQDEIFSKTQCTASIGIASNTLLAKLCTKKAKPNGIYQLEEDKVDEFMQTVPVKELPGVGNATNQKLKNLGITTCSQLQQMSLSALQSRFGKKQGQDLFENCRGESDQPIRIEKEQKVVSSTVNFGIRFFEKAETEKFVSDLAEVVVKKLKRTGVAGRTITVKLKIRKTNLPTENQTFLGHGFCDNRCRSNTLKQETDDLSIIQKECQKLLLVMKPCATDIRGVGIQISRLKKVSKSSHASKSLKDMMVKKEPNVTKSPELVKKRSEVTKSSKLNVTKTLQDVLVKKGSEVTKTPVLVKKSLEFTEPSKVVTKITEARSVPVMDSEPASDMGEQDSVKSPNKYSNKSAATDSAAVTRKGGLTAFLKPASMCKPKLDVSLKSSSKRRVLSTGDLPSEYRSSLDPDVLKELPPDILKEVLEEERSTAGKTTAVETLGHVDDLPSFQEIDQASFQALPTEIQGELLSAYRRKVSHMSEKTPEKKSPEKRGFQEELRDINGAKKKKKYLKDGSQSGSGKLSVQRSLFEVMNIQTSKVKARRHSAL
ncbi:uncharacterized protein [Apostichopus japonicus]